MTAREGEADARWYAWRGWILGGLFALLAAARTVSDRPLLPAGLFLLLLGMAWRLAAARHIHAHSNGLLLAAGPLARSGPYAFGRHPLYLANLLAAAGLLVFANALPAALAVLLFAAACLHHARLARIEERHLSAVHGEVYRRYMEVTPRWLGPSRRLPAFPARPGTRPGGEAGGPARPTGAMPEEGSRPPGDGLGEAFRRQRGNLLTASAAALVLWCLGRL